MWYLWSNCFPIVCFPDWKQNAQSLKRQVSKRAKRWNSERKRAPNFNFWCLIILEDIFSSGRKVGVITSRVLIFNFSSRKLLKMETSDLLPFLLSLRKSNQPRATFTETFKITSTVLIFFRRQGQILIFPEVLYIFTNASPFQQSTWVVLLVIE